MCYLLSNPMYWNNPVVTVRLTDSYDPVAESLHQGRHCLFYNPAVPIADMVKLISLQDTCNLANLWVQNNFLMHSEGDLDKVANAVRVNQYVHSLRTQGNIKPMLLNYTGTWPLGASTGGSRVMAAERCANIHAFSAFVATSSEFRSQFQHLESVTTLERFANICGAAPHTEMYFRLTDSAAPWGIDWYEVALDHTTVPNNTQCLRWLRHYVQQQSVTFEFTPDWFDQVIDWLSFDMINH